MENVFKDRDGRALKKGDRVSVEYPGDAPDETKYGIVHGAFPKDAQGVAGCVTVSLGMGIYEYVMPKFLRSLEP
jgi:hypothetical protein